MNWAAVNPAENSNIGNHLERFTDLRRQWAEASAEAWSIQKQAAKLRDEADRLTGQEPVQLEALRFDPEAVTKGLVGDIWSGGEVLRRVKTPLFLGRTSLVNARVFEDAAHNAIRMHDASYTHGLGPGADQAALLMNGVLKEAQNAAAGITADSTIDPIEAAVWRDILTAPHRVSTIDPESFAPHACRLAVKAQSALKSEPYIVAESSRGILEATKVNRRKPLNDIDHLVINATRHVGIRSEYESYSERSGYTTWIRNRSEFPYVKTDGAFTLLGPDQISFTAEDSFSRLRKLAGEEARSDFLVKADIDALDALEGERSSSDTVAVRTALQVVLNETGIKANVPGAGKGTADTAENIDMRKRAGRANARRTLATRSLAAKMQGRYGGGRRRW